MGTSTTLDLISRSYIVLERKRSLISSKPTMRNLAKDTSQTNEQDTNSFQWGTTS